MDADLAVPEIMKPIGKTRWAIAEGYIPSWSSSTRRELTSHDTACLLNAGEQHTRLDSRTADIALMTSAAYGD